MKLYIVNGLVIFFLLFYGNITLGQELTGYNDNIAFEIDVRNNLSELGNFFPSIDKDKLCLTDEIPESILARLNVNFQTPIWIMGNCEYGLLVQQLNWYRMDGEVIEFYQEVIRDELVSHWSYYNLGYEHEIYQRLGVYSLKREEISRGEIIFRGDFFIIPEYRKIEITGQGRIYSDLEGTKQAELKGSYRKGSINKTGWGGGLSCIINYRWDSEMEFNLALNNLLNIVYFPSYISENGNVDSTKNVLSPVYMSGFERKESVWSNLPMEMKAQFLYPITTGKLGLDLLKTGDYNDYSLSYLHSMRTIDSVISLRASPVMGSLDLGYLWRKGKFFMSVSPSFNWRLIGLGFSYYY